MNHENHKDRLLRMACAVFDGAVCHLEAARRDPLGVGLGGVARVDHLFACRVLQRIDRLRKLAERREKGGVTI